MDTEELEKELEKFKPNIEGISIDDLPSYEKLYNDYQEVQKKLTEKEIQFKKDLDNQKKQLGTIITQLTNKSVENTKISAELNELKKTLLNSPAASPVHARSYEDIEPLKTKMQQLEQKNSNLEEKIKQLEEENSQLKKESEQFTNKEKNMEENLKEIENMAIEAKTENAKIKSDKEMYCFKLQKLIKEIKAKNLSVNIDF